MHHRVLLGTDRGRILQFGNKQVFVDAGNRLLNQLLRLKADGIGILVVDISPQGLELFFVEIVIQRVLLDLRFMAIGDHIVEDLVVKYRLHQLVDPLPHF